MRSDLKNAFKHSFKNEVEALGYTRSSDTVFARDLAPQVLGCIGYLTGLQAIKPFVGVQFKRVERLYYDVMAPLLIYGKSLPRYYPTVSRDVFNLKEEHSADPDFRWKERDYWHIERETISHVSDQVLADIRLYGLPYIEANATLADAAATMAEGRGGGIGTVAYRLPMIYWILGRVDDANAYMASMATKDYPLGPYERYIELLTARMDVAAP